MWQERVKRELEELAEKIFNLYRFTESSMYEEIPKVQQDLLQEQLVHMERYASVLKLRLNNATTA